jgi:IclR family acetate operon transcriptional repressor
MATDEEVSAVTHEPLQSFTPSTLTRFEDLVDDLRTVRERGYAVDDEELNLDVRCVAAPIFDLYGSPVASLGLSGPAARVDRSRIADLGSQVRAAALQITQELGGHVPDAFAPGPAADARTPATD